MPSTTRRKVGNANPATRRGGRSACGAGSLLGAFVGSFVVGFLYNFGIALFPDLAYFILFLPMVLVLVFMPQGLFGRVPS